MTVIECQRCCDTDENDTPGHKAALVTTHPNLQATVTPSSQKQGKQPLGLHNHEQAQEITQSAQAPANTCNQQG